MADKTIFHCDCNSFYASVEETFHPQYRSVPMAIAGDPNARHGIILAKNELAKKYKVKTAETVGQARKKCPSLVLCPPRHKIYGEFCERVNTVYAEYTDCVERFGIDESFLDMSIFAGEEEKYAAELRRRIAQEIGITISVGVSWNKIFAKLGSDYKKPDATTLITKANYKEIVFPLPVGDLFGVGKKTAEKLAEIGVRTIEQLAAVECDYLTGHFGKLGEVLYRNANGLGDDTVAKIGDGEAAKSVGNGMTFKRNLETLAEIRIGTNALADSVAARLRRHNVKCTTVQVTIKDTSLQSIQRQKGVSPTFLATEIAKSAIEVIELTWKIGKPIRMLTITASNLIPADQVIQQLSLFETTDTAKREKQERLEQAVDRIHSKFGEKSIRRGAGNKELGIE
ncbi:DNA polymerase IV 1 [Clostridia bacterium]|nr:DNA polymerase IV 1 [Clostridia bacterium]